MKAERSIRKPGSQEGRKVKKEGKK